MTEQKPRVLIIEDNLDLLEMYQIKFAAEGFDVRTAADGEKGILMAVEFKPDVILLDILMPNMDGYQVLKAIRDNTGLASKILVLSNLGQQEQIQKAKELGATEFLIKANYQPSDVVKKVRETLGMQVVTQQIPVAEEKAETANVTGKLMELKKLLDDGVISQQEFEDLKKKIIEAV